MLAGPCTQRVGAGAPRFNRHDRPGRAAPLAIAGDAAFVGNVVFQALLAFPLPCRQWAWAFVVSGSLLACILVAIIVLLVPRPAG